jgi:hypothetical protein
MPSTLVRSTVLLLALSATALSVLGCNADPGADNGKGDHMPAPLPPSMETLTYPAGPYGVVAGATLDDFSFPGVPDAKTSKTEVTIHLSDFYNPHGKDSSYEPADAASDDRLYPPGSPYGAGTKKPLGLFIDIASVWCGPCNLEAKTELPMKHAEYRPCGGEFLFQLAEGAAPGTPATAANLAAWTSTYKVDYPSTYDQKRLLSVLYGGGAFPDGVVIDTSTMRILQVVSGLPDDNTWQTFESTLDAACLAGK